MDFCFRVSCMARDTDIRTDGRTDGVQRFMRPIGTREGRIYGAELVQRSDVTRRKIYTENIVNQPLQEVRGYKADSAFTAHDGIVDIVVD